MSIEPDLGLGDVDLIIPDNTIAMGIGMRASENHIVLQWLKGLEL